jgi:hypothetical protein
MSRLLIKNNSNDIDLINTFLYEFKNNNIVSLIDFNTYTFNLEFLINNSIENVKGNIIINSETILSKQSVCDFSSSIITDSQFISNFDFNINNFSVAIDTITLIYNSNNYSCSSKVIINGQNYYIFDIVL